MNEPPDEDRLYVEITPEMGVIGRAEALKLSLAIAGGIAGWT